MTKTLNPVTVATVYDRIKTLLHNDERIVMAALKGREMSVNAIESACPQLCQPEVSQALANLLRAGVVHVISNGRHRIYWVNADRVRLINSVAKKLIG